MEIKMKKPMLLSNDEIDLRKIDYTKSNWYISKKRDGIRAEVTNEGIKNRSLKILRNTKIKKYFEDMYKHIPDGVVLEGEIYSDATPCREMAGICNSLDKDVPDDTKIYLFGLWSVVYKNSTFENRMEYLKWIYNNLLPFEAYKFDIVVQKLVASYGDIMEHYKNYLDVGFEGAVLMNGSSKYKEGRVTIKQEIGFKLKPDREDDLKIIGVTERMENLNESQTNELGQSYKRNTVDAKKGTGIAATFVCLMSDGKTETKVTITGDEKYRRDIWKNKEEYIGMYAVVKSMDYGTKTKLRHPRLIGIKEQVEK